MMSLSRSDRQSVETSHRRPRASDTMKELDDKDAPDSGHMLPPVRDLFCRPDPYHGDHGNFHRKISIGTECDRSRRYRLVCIHMGSLHQVHEALTTCLYIINPHLLDGRIRPLSLASMNLFSIDPSQYSSIKSRDFCGIYCICRAPQGVGAMRWVKHIRDVFKDRFPVVHWFVGSVGSYNFPFTHYVRYFVRSATDRNVLMQAIMAGNLNEACISALYHDRKRNSQHMTKEIVSSFTNGRGIRSVDESIQKGQHLDVKGAHFYACKPMSRAYHPTQVATCP